MENKQRKNENRRWSVEDSGCKTCIMLGIGKGEGRPKGDTQQPEKCLEDGRVEN